MKTPEDEEFEAIERRQQNGFHVKKAAAIAKINADFDEEYIKYREAFPKGYTAPQQGCEPVPKAEVLNTLVNLMNQAAQEPVAILECAYGYSQCKALEIAEKALAQPAQEPVAWMYDWLCDGKLITGWIAHDESEIPKTVASNICPLYTAPPQRKWVGLTDEDKQKLAAAQPGWEELIGAVEAKLKEKNG